MKKENLVPKMIMDFTTEDTIYIRRKIGRDNAQFFLCQFIEYKGNKVKGKAISTDVNPKMYQSEIDDGLEISATIQNCALYGNNPVSDRKYYHWFDSSGYAIYPYEYKKVRESADIVNEHPSFGLIGISRVTSSGGVPLFGSSIQHKETIRLTIRTAKVDRDLSREWYYGKKELIEIEMSSTQFAEFITTPNRGDGVPCTIKHIERNTIPMPPFESKKDMFSKEFENAMKNISSGLESETEILNSLLEKKSIGKGDKELIKSLFGKYKSKISNSLPFIVDSFTEQMDQTVLEAKGEVESFITRRVTEEGRKVLLGEDGSSAKLIHE